MKKKIINLSILSSLLLGSTLSLNSCRDAIDIVQDGEINQEVFFSSVDNMDKYLLGDVYPNIDNSNAVYLTSIITDEVRPGKDSGGQGYGIHRLYLDSSDELSRSIWLQNNLTINRATRLIEGAKLVTPTANETGAYNNIIAQARAIRALAYLQQLTYFSEDMSNENALGILVLKDKVPTAETKLPRSTNKEVYAAIEEDLTFAENNLLNQSSRYYVSKDLVNAIRARLNLYRGKYSEAKQYAQKVLDLSRLSLSKASLPGATVDPNNQDWVDSFYADNSSSPYRKIWSDAAQGEAIFTLSRPEVGRSYTFINSRYNTNLSRLDGQPLWVMGLNLFNILDNTPGDIRRYAFIDPSTDLVKQPDQIIIDKYPGKGSAALKNDVKVFRLSEMYFILAECAVNDGDLASARNYIQQVRKARNYSGTATTPNYTSAQEALADILKERRVELAFEGHRYIDLKRLAAKAGVTMDRNSADDISGVPVKNLENGDYRYTLPIPLSEIAGNPGIQQNRGY